MDYTVKYNRSTNHIEGLDERTTGGGKDMGDHISDYAQSACGALTRSGHNMGTGATSDDLAAILKSARASYGNAICKKCEAAAVAMLEAQAAAES